MTNRHACQRYRVWYVDTDLSPGAATGPLMVRLDPHLAVRRRNRLLRSLVGGPYTRHVTSWPK
jgi:hypothetical protein